MGLTDYHAKYFAHELTKRYSSDNAEKLATSLLDAQVDLNPHQIDAALFAFKTPLSKGAILADEVGLGKTIEAGLVISQKWAERKRRVLVIVPSNLRNQWSQEMADKFFISSVILETKSFNTFVKMGMGNPFEQDDLVICSYHFVRSKAEYVKLVNWDLVVIDEAHRLRNVYKTSNKIARAIRNAIEPFPKILLTATPLQNTLLELFGLVSFIDAYIFGDKKSFTAQFAKLTGDDNFDELKERLSPICKRTLRKQVLEYIKYTNRVPITQEFVPTAQEQKLNEYVAEYLHRQNLFALPSSQRNLITLILHKLLSSSSFAIAGALSTLINRLEKLLKDTKRKIAVDDELADDFEALDEIKDEWENDDNDEVDEVITEAQIKAINGEIADLKKFRDLAVSITNNAKGEALLIALKTGFAKAKELGGQEKVVIFTESRKTQDYLLRLLSETEHKDKIVLFNGSNSDQKSKDIYKAWYERYQGTDRVTESKTSDLRSALVDYFKNQATVFIATEAAAEGINLQFCSMLINYDLPWNPQRVEQRIGRCHRYGQKFDVVVVNFINKNNPADKRVYELLDQKFKLFSGVFGASDEVLGSIESGVDFEKRIAQIYQNCRTPKEIDTSFNALQQELEGEIDEKVTDTKKKLLEHFDEEVHEKLKLNIKESKEYLSKHEGWLWDLTKYWLGDNAEFSESGHSFMLKNNPFTHDTIHPGPYRIGRNVDDANVYRVGHRLAQNIIKEAKEKEIPHATLEFSYTNHPLKISILDPLVGKFGTLNVSKMTVDSFEAEDHIILNGITDDGQVLDEEQCRRFFSLPATNSPLVTELSPNQVLVDMLEKRKNDIVDGIEQKNSSYFEIEMDKLDKWADDKKKTLKSGIKELDDKIKVTKKEARLAPNLPEKLKLQKEVKKLDSKRDEAWMEFKDASKDVENMKDELIEEVEAMLKQNVTVKNLFAVKWKVI